MRRYAALLLLQYRVETKGVSNRLRTCEQRIILLQARSAQTALSKAKRAGKAAETDFRNSTGGTVFIEFVGVQDLLDVDWCNQGEVWYEILELRTPMERKAKLIPRERDLNAIRNERESKQSKAITSRR